MGNFLSGIFCCSDCCGEPEPIHKVIQTGSRRQSNLTEVSSPSQLEVKQLTEVHKVNKLNKKSVNSILSQYNFQLDEKIGAGSYSTVFKAHLLADRNGLKKGQIVACKVVDISPETKDRNKRMELVKNELFILEKIKHKHIIQMYEHFIVEDHKLYLFMDYASGGDLSGQLEQFGPFKEDQCRTWFRQIVDGVSYLHGQKIAHRDLKLQNILLDDNKKVMITDFGLSQVSFRKEKEGVRKGGIQWSRTYCGTLPYMAPEIVKSYNKTVFYDPFAADIWALAVILFLLYNKTYPYNPESKSMISLMNRKTLNWNRNVDKPSKALSRLFDKLFEPDHDLRITIDRIKSHHWVTNELPNSNTTSDSPDLSTTT